MHICVEVLKVCESPTPFRKNAAQNVWLTCTECAIHRSISGCPTLDSHSLCLYVILFCLRLVRFQLTFFMRHIRRYRIRRRRQLSRTRRVMHCVRRIEVLV